ncbi:MAG: hypothetical protein IFK94_08085 [Acidobacteria bacterium]|uniref:Uncharacterized protein n=1 Tax=Candidatus Polarisedimenticola svalbardensis TaxID=2886004 RepID=A0A8J7CEC9_9BACT|nr:hypothetical protein [Candidatus Polarisedimenticola svalbardensis]
MPIKTPEQLNERVDMLQKKLTEAGDGTDPVATRRLKKSIRRSQRKARRTTVLLEKRAGKKEEAAKEA